MDVNGADYIIVIMIIIFKLNIKFIKIKNNFYLFFYNILILKNNKDTFKGHFSNLIDSIKPK
jgi:hypothetical protein